MPKELCEELLQRKKQIEKDKEYYRDKYTDYNLVFSLDDGYPVEPKLCEKWFKKWQKITECELPNIIFHGVRHSSATYKLSLTGGDIKSVQGDTGHATADMVLNRYSHIQDSGRRHMTSLLEEDFYNKKISGKISPEDMEIQNFMKLLENNPELKKQFVSEIIAETKLK